VEDDPDRQQGGDDGHEHQGGGQREQGEGDGTSNDAKSKAGSENLKRGGATTGSAGAAGRVAIEETN
jgi:hypothetical protein